MAKKKHDDFDEYADEYGQDELDDLLELLEDFPEIGEYLEDILDLGEGDFYGQEK